jgi:hypothetical protein
VTVSQADVTVARMFPYYICTVIFLMPYLAAVTYYPLQVSFYIDQVGVCCSTVACDFSVCIAAWEGSWLLWCLIVYAGYLCQDGAVVA